MNTENKILKTFLVVGLLTIGISTNISYAMTKESKMVDFSIEKGCIIIEFKEPDALLNKTRITYNRDGTWSDISDFIGNKGVIVSWRENYPVHKRIAELTKEISEGSLALRQECGKPIDHNGGGFCEDVTLTDSLIKTLHQDAIANIFSDISWAANRLAKFKKDQFSNLRRLAILSFGRPVDKDNFDAFYIPAVNFMAQVMDATWLLVFIHYKKN